MYTQAPLHFPATQARSAMNIIAQHSASLPVSSLRALVSQRAIKASADKLEFADGSVLRFDATTSGCLAT